MILHLSGCASPPQLLITLEAAASLMEISKEDLILKVLTRWEKDQTLPLHGEDRLCSLKYEDFTDNS